MDAHLQAYVELANAIAQHSFSKAKFDDAIIRKLDPDAKNAPWPVYCHDHMSTYENAVSHLIQLRIMKDISEDYRLRFCYFTFVGDPAEARSVAKQNWKDGPSFDELFFNFVELFGEFGAAYWGFSTSKNEAFGENSRIALALDALVALGYLEKIDTKYRWTDLAAPAMQTAGFWPSDMDQMQTE